MNARSRRGRRVSAAAGALVLAISLGLVPAATTSALDLIPDGPIGLTQLLAANPVGSVRAIATLDTTPGAAQVGALRALGLAVQPMRHLPLAVVVGTVAQFQAAVSGGAARDVYPDAAIELLDTTSSDAMGAASLRAAGLTGKGVTVGIVDSGCDASHPDLGDHVVHNVKLYSGEYANVRPDGTSTIVIANEVGPYQNTDIGGGHGTHVAGIVAADSTTAADGSRFGVAPDAELVCYSIGEVLFTTAVVTAYDHMLDQPDLWGIDVVNNSWGNSFQQFDPRAPVAVATKAVADLGVVVVFAAGNSGSENAEMSLNPFSQSPWVISVASSTVARVRAGSSSNGLMFDNAEAVTIGAGGRTTFTGDRIGIYHPDVTAPGQSISSTCSTAGTAIRACPPPNYTNTTASGTSMASPHVAGAAAILLQANPNLTPDQVRKALQGTATPVTDAAGTSLAFWQIGFGFVNLDAAVSLVREKKFASRIDSAAAKADARVLGADGFKVQRSDFWTYDSPRATVAGTDTHTFSVDVPAGTTDLKVTLSHPSGAVVGVNGLSYTVTVRDAAGTVLGTTTESITAGAGTASVLIDLGSAQPAFGAFTFEVVGDYAASDPDTIDSESLLGRMVTLQVSQLTRG